MKEKKQYPKFFLFFEPLMILTFWLILFSSPILLGDDETSIEWQKVFTVWKSFLPYLFLFLINHFILLPFLFFKNRRWLFLMSAIILIASMALGVHFLDANNTANGSRNRPMGVNKFQPPPLGRGIHTGPQGLPKQLPPPNQLPPHLSFMLISFLIIGFDTGLKLSVKWVQSEQKRMNAEKQNMESQLAFLRNQVSPHFFMNTLNNIHSLIDLNTEEAKESIIRLSRLMRHLLYDSETENIPITKEIEFIRNYVDLMKLRFSDKVEITLDILNPLPQKSIPPLLFTSFVENAFKHGISYQNSSFINISFSHIEDRLIFEISNSNHNSNVDEASSGIGIENSKKRLDLIYGVKYDLKIENKETEFRVYLSIPV